MPNWCMNRLKVSGKIEEVKKFIKDSSSTPTKFLGNLLPCPQPLLEVTAGSHEIYYDISYGDLEKVSHYPWLPSKNDEDTEETRREEMLKATALNFGHALKESKQWASQYKQNVDSYGHKSWYSWSISNWGTKWDIDVEITDQHEEGDDSFVVFAFDSAWSPPAEAIIKIAANYPELEFDLEFYEPGMDFGGRLLVRDQWVEVEETIQLSAMTESDSDDFPFVWDMLVAAREEENEWRKQEEAGNEA
jgi:hypothetical protein